MRAGAAAPSTSPLSPIQPARQVDGEAVQPLGSDGLDGRERHPGERPGQTAAEQRIDHQRPAPRQVRRQGFDLAWPALRRQGGIAGEPPALAQQGQAHGHAGLAQVAGGHEAIPTIVARPAEHQGRAAGQRRSAASATASPAFSMSSMPEVPPAMAAASAARISAALSKAWRSASRSGALDTVPSQ